MYTSFFGFKCKPFQLTPDPEFLFLSRVHKRALTYLNYGITDNFGFILITGPIGTGKTTIIRTLLKKIPQEIKIARINNTKVTSHQLISMINDEFSLETKGRDKTQLLSELTDFLIQQYAEGGRAVLIIDEAQNLSVDMLEEVRLLSNLETDKSKLLQIILIGQPELNLTLSRPELEQLRQRIAINIHLSPLSREETETYIMHRLKIAGDKDAVKFENGAIDAIYNFSKGTPRLINIICEFALLAAFADERKIVDLNLIKEVAGDLINESPEIKANEIGFSSTGKEDISNKLKKALKSFSHRLINIEAAIYELQNEPANIIDKNKNLISIHDAKQKKKIIDHPEKS